MTQILTGEDKTIITVLLVVYHVLANSSNGRRLTRENEEDDLNEALPLPCVCSCRQYEREGARVPHSGLMERVARRLLGPKLLMKGSGQRQRGLPL
jgi:hypothetical protein